MIKSNIKIDYDAIAKIQQSMPVRVVQHLPAAESSEPNVFYLVWFYPGCYEEYILADNQWIFIGYLHT